MQRWRWCSVRNSGGGDIGETDRDDGFCRRFRRCGDKDDDEVDNEEDDKEDVEDNEDDENN